MDERYYWLAFSVFPGVGPGRFRQLLQQFTSAEQAWNAPQSELAACIGKAFAQKLVDFRKTFNVEEYVQHFPQDISFLPLYDKEYPETLKAVNNAPFVLYVKGNIRVLHQPSIAIVGTRNITYYGKDVTASIAKALVEEGYAVTSGLAYGVDAIAHSTTVSNDGQTIAVLGCGVDCCYPRANQKIYDAIIASGGAIVSEFPLSMNPSVGSFPSRNRIIAGLSEAVVVTEGSEDSGALYTADEAFKLGRNVFAVPGPITSRLSKGPLGLIAKGAIMVMGVEDIVTALGRKSIKGIRGIKSIKGDTEEEQVILDLLHNERMYFDDIVRQTKLSSAQLGSVLSLMEMKGMITSELDGSYAISA